MANDGHGWIFKAIKLVTKDEVKTPLSFLFKVVPFLIAGTIVTLYAPVSESLKLMVFYSLGGALLLLSGVVLLFAWFRPKNLVYGETGHRAEHKIEYGTEARSVTHEERDALIQESNPKLPAIEAK